MNPKSSRAAGSVAGKAGRYLVTGSIAAVVDVGVFAGLFAAGMAVPAAAAIGFVLATICNYWMSAPYVFGAVRGVAGYFKFLAAAALGFLINVGLTSWLPGPLATLLPPRLVAVLPPLPIVAKVIAIGVAFGFNFVSNLLLVFRRS